MICHMAASLDGRIDCAMTEVIGGDEYYDTLEQLGAKTEINGKVTAQMHFALPVPFEAKDNTPFEETGWSVAEKSDDYRVILDTHGTLQYESNHIGPMPALVIVSETAPKAYLDYLDGKGISWIAVGTSRIDLAKAMEILHDAFGIERAIVTGGGHLNGSFLQAGLLDEVSMQFNPGIDGRKGMAAAFDGIEDPDFGPIKLTLLHVKQFDNGTVEMRYKV